MATPMATVRMMIVASALMSGRRLRRTIASPARVPSNVAAIAFAKGHFPRANYTLKRWAFIPEFQDDETHDARVVGRSKGAAITDLGDAILTLCILAHTKGSDGTDKVVKRNEEWRTIPALEQCHVTRLKGTERGFFRPVPWASTREYTGVAAAPRRCSAPQPNPTSARGGRVSELDPSHVVEEDDSLRMRRNRVVCAAHDARLGHTFLGGTPPKEPRCSMNSAAQVLNEEAPMDIEVIDSWTVA